MNRSAAVSLFIALVGAGVVHTSQLQTDAVRRDVDLENELMFMPSGEALRVAASGFEQQIGDLLWIRAILIFGEEWGGMNEERSEWLVRMIQAVAKLDPQWRTTYYYGGVMLRVVGDVDASTEVFTAGHEALPDDYFFPFAIGMNFYLHKDDPFEAGRWLKIAAGLPKAPEWYAKSARMFVVQKTQRSVALRHLDEELAASSDPNLREYLEEQKARLLHDGYVEALMPAIAEYEEREGRRPTALQDLIDLGVVKQGFPPDPLGGQWVMDITGEIVSDLEVEDREELARATERQLLEPRYSR